MRHAIIFEQRKKPARERERETIWPLSKYHAKRVAIADATASVVVHQQLVLLLSAPCSDRMWRDLSYCKIFSVLAFGAIMMRAWGIGGGGGGAKRGRTTASADDSQERRIGQLEEQVNQLQMMISREFTFHIHGHTHTYATATRNQQSEPNTCMYSPPPYTFRFDAPQIVTQLFSCTS